jgi:hypothetical protein
VVWTNQAAELWRRTEQAITRHLNQLVRRRGLPRVRGPHGKVAEFQAAGRPLPRPAPPGRPRPRPTRRAHPTTAGITIADPDQAAGHAAAHIAYTTQPHPDRPQGWRIGWGDQVDVRTIGLRGDHITDTMVASYLAKYATKSTEITGHTSRRLHQATIGLYADSAGRRWTCRPIAQS